MKQAGALVAGSWKSLSGSASLLGTSLFGFALLVSCAVSTGCVPPATATQCAAAPTAPVSDPPTLVAPTATATTPANAASAPVDLDIPSMTVRAAAQFLKRWDGSTLLIEPRARPNGACVRVAVRIHGADRSLLFEAIGAQLDGTPLELTTSTTGQRSVALRAGASVSPTCSLSVSTWRELIETEVRVNARSAEQVDLSVSRAGIELFLAAPFLWTVVGFEQAGGAYRLVFPQYRGPAELEPTKALFEQLGLKDGDEILSVAGHPALGDSHAMRDSVRTARTFEVKARRNGRPLLLKFAVVEGW